MFKDKDMNLLYEDDMDSDYDFDPYDDAEEKIIREVIRE